MPPISKTFLVECPESGEAGSGGIDNEAFNQRNDLDSNPSPDAINKDCNSEDADKIDNTEKPISVPIQDTVPLSEFNQNQPLPGVSGSSCDTPVATPLPSGSVSASASGYSGPIVSSQSNSSQVGHSRGASSTVSTTVGHSRGASSTDGSTIDAYCASSATESRRGTYSEAGTLPIGMLPEGEPIIEENGTISNGRPSIVSNGLHSTSSNGGILQATSSTAYTHKLKSLTRPLMKSKHPLNHDATKMDKFKHQFLCPPSGTLGYFLTSVLLLLLFWLSLLAIARESALPGGSLFSLFVLVVLAELGGRLAGILTLPPLLGMLLVGIALRSIPGVDIIGQSIDSKWSSLLRSMALVVILIRAGLGLDPVALKKLKLVVLRLACLPCLTETMVVAIVSRLLLGFPWIWGIMLGFVLSAVSPAVVVPCLLKLDEDGWGVDKGIPTLVIAAASIDDVIAISGFGVTLGLTFAKGSATYQAFKGPIEVIIGLSFGIIVGILLWVFPYRKEKDVVRLRVLLLLCAGVLAIFGSKAINFGGAGALGCLTVAFVAGLGWRKGGHQASKGNGGGGMQVKDYFGLFWQFFQPLLFGLIGTEIQISALDPATIGWGMLTLAIGLTLRCIMSFFAVMGGDFTIKERLFIALAWLPKATVQAAIGSTALDYAREVNPNPGVESEEERLGKMLLTIAVLVILITAPIGAIAIMNSAPKLLTRTIRNEEKEEV